ncbi:MAG: hypothetical protein J6Y20_14485 [Lachnospiraceae bacterium]|nr:hypothetical protein [Lachnospiraceae bacterium]
MANSTRICKVCGKEYPYCKTELKDGNIFRWQDVACCQEHGAEYFALVAKARGEATGNEDCDADDDFEEEDFFDDEDEEEEDDDEEDEEEDIEIL